MSSWIKSIKEVLKRNKYDKENNITRRNTILDEMSLDNFDEEKLQILSTDGMLVKRPLLELDDVVLIGFKENEWQNI